jgi:hemolysin activation/secretion protein
LLVVLFFIDSVSAAVPPIPATVLPTSVLPEQVSKALTKHRAPGNVRAPFENAEAQKKAVLPPEAKKIKFTLNGIILEGNHVYSSRDLSQIYRKQLHKKISVADLFEIVQEITNYYRNNGYIITRAILPPQHVKNGVVRIRIIEGYIDKVNVTGKPLGVKCLVYAYGTQIRKCRPLHLDRMERYLLIDNEIPATQVKAVLTPSKSKVGAADLNLVTSYSPTTGYLSYDDYGTRYLGPQQITANLGLHSIFSAGDAYQVTATKTPKGSELTYWDMNYGSAIGCDGSRGLIGGTYVRTHPLFVLQPVQIDGVNNNYYTGIQYPYVRTRSSNVTFQAGFNYLDSQVTSFGQKLYRDHLRSLDFSATSNYADRWSGLNYVTADIRQGLPIFGYTQSTNISSAQTSRPGGHAVYTKVNLQYSRLQPIKGAFSFYGLVHGQYAAQPLLASEQYPFGGSQLGRGYDVAEILGDHGLAGTMEARYDLEIGHLLMQSIQFYAFYDWGKIWNRIQNIGLPLDISGTTAGFGARFFTTKYISGNVMWTQSLTKQVAAEELIGDGRRPRVFFSVVAALG